MGLLQGLILLLKLGQGLRFVGRGHMGVMEPGGAWRERHSAAGTWVGITAWRLQEGLARHGEMGGDGEVKAGAQAAGEAQRSMFLQPQKDG